MSITPKSMINELNNCGDFLQKEGICLHRSQIIYRDNQITWAPSKPDVQFLENTETDTVDTYLRWVDAGHYSCLLFDGSLLQMSFRFVRERLQGQRLAYVPSPFRDIILGDFNEPIQQQIEEQLSKIPGSIRMHSTLRIDYDPNVARDDHPITHFTINHTDCRIPCTGPVHPGAFLNFVFGHFYPNQHLLHEEYFKELGLKRLSMATITRPEQETLHLAFR